MDNEKTRVMLLYVKVLLSIHGVKDKDVNEAMDNAIEAFSDGQSNPHYI